MRDAAKSVWEREETTMDANATRLDPRIPARDECVLRYVLEKWSALKPDQVYAAFHRGPSVTYREMHGIAQRAVLRLDHARAA